MKNIRNINIKILIVDDTESIRFQVKKTIKDNFLDIETYEAENGKDGIEKIKIYNPDIIILDLNMPKLNGESVLEYVSFKKIKNKIIMLTAEKDKDKIIDLIHHNNVKDYIMKPYIQDRLISGIKKCIE